MDLSMGQNFSGREILKVLVICDNVTGSTSAFQIVFPDTERFFVMGVIVELRRAESIGMECNKMNFTGVSLNGKNSAKGHNLKHQFPQ